MTSVRLSTLCAAALLSLLASAQAAPVLSGVASYNLGSSSPPGGTASPSTSCGAGGQDSLIFTGSGVNNIGIHSYSCGTGFYQFGSRSSGENTYYVDGRAGLEGSLSTLGGFSFFINAGEVGAFGSTAFAAGEFQKSMLSIKLVIDGTTYMDEAWSSEVGAGGAITSSYASTGPYSVFNSYTSGAGYASYGLSGGGYFIGLADGDHDISYVMSSLAAGNVSSTSACTAVLYPAGGGGDGVGKGVEALALVNEGGGAGDPFSSYCGAGARSGDPFSPAIARVLPEPASAGLTAVALLAALGLRRRPSKA